VAGRRLTDILITMRCVYLIRNLINGKVYVGQTKNFAQRKAGHLRLARHPRAVGGERPLYRSMRKHGIGNFTFELLEECEDQFVDEREQYWVVHFDSFNPKKGYNLTNGGQEFSEECIHLISKRTREAMAKGDPSWKARQREAMKDPEVRRLISERTKAAMQRPEVAEKLDASRDETWRQRISETLMGHVISEETRQKIRETLRSRPKKKKPSSTCQRCGGMFEVRKKNQRYCSHQCYWGHVS